MREQQYVGIDLHRRRSVIVRMNDAGAARHLCSWAGMTPKLHESDTKSHSGKITKQGSTIVRWAVVESVSRYHGGAPIAPAFARIAERRGKKIAQVAAARRLLTLVFYGLRDGVIRCLEQETA